MRGRALALALLLLAQGVQADTSLAPDPLAYTQLPDAGQERRATSLMATLRCVVCQGQSIADSDADMAATMRALVRRRVAAGEDTASIRAWLVERYGDYITYDPPLSVKTAPLWLAPLALLAIGAWLARGSFRRRPRVERR